MKYNQLKKCFKQKYSVRIIAGVLVVTLAGGSLVGCSSQQTEKALQQNTVESEEEEPVEDVITTQIADASGEGNAKEETIYVIADSAGAAQKVIASEHLINREGTAQMEDTSSLTDIVNVKGEETFAKDGDRLVWDAAGRDIYYQGTASDELPVTQKISYYLDGTEIAPEELAGKSGKVTIRFDYTNHEFVEAEIDGKTEELCVPFLALSGMVLDERFQNIEVSNGKVVSDGNHTVVFGYTLPGLADALQIKEGDLQEDIKLPSYFEMSADVTDFELDMSMTVVVNAADYMEQENSGDAAGITDMVEMLSDATAQLQDGSTELAEGCDSLEAGVEELAEGVDTLSSGVTAYTKGAGELVDGIETLAKNSPSLSSGVSTLNTSAATLCEGVELLDTGLNTPFTEQEQKNLQQQVSDAVVGQETMIKESAKKEVEKQSEEIRQQAQKSVEAQADAIQTQAKLAVTSAFEGGQYEAIAKKASEQVASQMASTESIQAVSAGIEKSEVYAYIQQGIRMAALQQVIEASNGAVTTMEQAEQIFMSTNGVSVDAFAEGKAKEAVNQLSSGIMEQLAKSMAPTMGDSVAQTAQLAAETAAQSAAVESAKSVAGTAAVNSALQTAQSAAYQGAVNAAGMSAVTVAEQTKRSIASQMEQTGENGYSLLTGMQALAEGTQNLQLAVPSLVDGISKLDKGGKKLVKNNDALTSGLTELSNGTDALSGGAGSLSDGAHQLADGMVQFNEEGISKILDAYKGDTKALLERLQAAMDAGKSYQTYTDLAEGTSGSVRFIYKTAAIKK